MEGGNRTLLASPRRIFPINRGVSSEYRSLSTWVGDEKGHLKDDEVGRRRPLKK